MAIEADHTASKNTTIPAGEVNLFFSQNDALSKVDLATKKTKKNYFIQPKLTIGAPDDPYEKEADAVADKVMRMSENVLLQRKGTDFLEEKIRREEKKPADKIQSNLRLPETDFLRLRTPFAGGIALPLWDPGVVEDKTTQAEKSNPQNNFQRKFSGCVGEDIMAHSFSKNISPLIQTKTQIDSAITPSLSVSIQQSLGGGTFLEPMARSFLENRMGTDFSGVKVHSGPDAVQMNRELNAKAFTVGPDVYFNEGQYQPGTDSGKYLLAHELTHVVQQTPMIRPQIIQKRGLADGHNLQSPRFAKNPELEDAFDYNTGGQVIKRNQSGLHVTILQQALIDAGHPLPLFGVDGDFGNETENKVKDFQGSQGLTGSSVDGEVGTVTMGLMDQYFLNHGTLAAIPSSATPGNSLAGTRSLSAAEIAAIERSRTTEVQAPPGGVLPTFQMTIPGQPDNYETRVENETNRIITALYIHYASGKIAQRAAAGGLHTWSSIEQVADQSKRETDRVFGAYASGPALHQGTNLFDAWEEKERQYAAGGAAFEQRRVEWRVNKIFSGSQIRAIDEQHGAVQSRTSPSNEAGILSAIRTRIIAARRSELIEIDHGWPGFADTNTGSIFIQRFTSPTAAGNRNFMWTQFQTLVHEYIHTLAHPNYRTYYASLPEMRGGKTYREGMTDYFTKMVLESTAYDAALRRDVEGTYHNPAITHPIPGYGGYGEAENAEAVAGIAGIRNVMAAFFIGRTDLIGGP